MKTYERYYKLVAALVDNLHYNLDDADYYKYQGVRKKYVEALAESEINAIMLKKTLDNLIDTLHDDMKEVVQDG